MSTDSPMEKPAYHHGNLVEALLAAAVALIEEKGVETLSVREVAKRAGVSPGAPFRHFPSKTALLTAVAEQAMARLSTSVEEDLSRLGSLDPLGAIHAMGRAYLQWALANPTHFQVISSRSLIDFHGSRKLVDSNEALRRTAVRLFEDARASGQLRAGLGLEDVIFAARAFVYGVARMWVDRHFSEWNVTKPPAEAMEGALDVFIRAISAGPVGEAGKNLLAAEKN